MADESMSVDQEVNGEETSSVPQVNGVDIADEQDEVKLDGKETENAVVTEETSFKEDNSPDSPIELNYEEDSPSQEKIKENIDNEDIACDDDAKENSNGLNNKQDNIPDTPVVISKSRKRKASSDDDQELNGFDPPEQPSPLIKARIDKLEKDIKEAEQDPARWTSSRPPLKKAHLASPAHSIEMSSRPSSGLSVRSESELIGGHVSDLNSSVSSPSATPKIRKSTVDLSNPLYRIPLEQGWKRELVYRATVDQYQRRQGDIYYYTPAGKKLRSNREVSEHLAGTGLSMEHFTFFKEPLGVDDPEKEIIRDAKLMRNRTDSPVNTVEKSPASAALIREGKRTPKPKGPKGASPERGNVLTPKLTTPFKVKSMGSRLSGQGSPATSAAPVKVAAKELAKTLPVTKKTTAKWKKNKESAEESPIVTPEKKTRGTPTPRVTPAPPPAKKNTKPEKAAAEDDTPTGSKRSRGKSATSDNKDAKPTQESSLKTLMQCGMFVQIFGYLNKRELAAAARVCRSWRDIAYTPSLWRTVRMKNTQVTDWQGLATALKKHKTRHLDLRKMLLPADDTDNIWDQFTKHIACVDSLLRIELCRCPASVVERVCKGLPQLQALTSTSIRCAKLNPSPLSSLTNLTELRIKGMNGLNLTSDLKCLEHLTKLKHLSITSIRELEKLHCESIGSLSLLESLELGECTFPGESGADILGPLRKLARLRLEKSPPDGAAQVVQAAAALPKLTHLELINFEIKAGFEDALAACTNVKRLLIIPMYISQSATTNHCVLDGVLRLRNSLTHLVWGVTIELLRVTELFIDQCDRPGEGGASRPPKAAKKSNMGDCIPVLKPVPGLSSSSAGSEVSEKADRPQASPAQVEILPLPALQHLLTTELPDTRLKILRIPFHSTWRQALSDLD